MPKELRKESVFAHGSAFISQDVWHTLVNHSDSVANLCSSFASSFNSGCFGRLIGKVHDIGKARDSFQAYLRHCCGIEKQGGGFGDKTHSGAGACWLYDNGGLFGKALAYCVAGHHAGLPDWSGGETPDGALDIRITNERRVLSEPAVVEFIKRNGGDWMKEKLATPFKFSQDDSSLSFWIRMMYSCLVDADFLDTESFLAPMRAAARPKYDSLESIAKRFTTQLDRKQRSSVDTPVNRIRAEVRSACESASGLPQGMFSLTVPTGGGKTLSGTAFALRHALSNGLKRIIYVIPYTSIIEQTSDVLCNFLGNENVVEHHSNFDQDKESTRTKLSSENWDAPIVVTTAVQFFESLYSCKPSRCRKLHNIAESVVILDEVQLLPPRLLLPCAEAIRQLAQHYRTSIVLSTATQLELPGLALSSVRELMPASLDLYHRLKRVDIEFPDDRETRKSWDEVADELMKYRQVLCIVNSRRDCRSLHSRMPDGTIHLSASMCGEHRSRVISDIKRKLSAGEPIRVISTQLVEAGVDIDFPVVYRAFAGLSSIAQSAGRCNREGRLEDLGKVVVFMPPKASFVKDLLYGEYAMGDLLDRTGGVDLDDAQSYPDFFRALYKRISDCGRLFGPTLGVPVPEAYRDGYSSAATMFHFQFRESAAAFKMIEDTQVPVTVCYGEGTELIKRLKQDGPSLDLLRKMQRYSVSVPEDSVDELLRKGIVEAIADNTIDEEEKAVFYVQASSTAYRDDVGLDILGGGEN